MDMPEDWKEDLGFWRSKVDSVLAIAKWTSSLNSCINTGGVMGSLCPYSLYKSRLQLQALLSSYDRSESCVIILRSKIKAI